MFGSLSRLVGAKTPDACVLFIYGGPPHSTQFLLLCTHHQFTPVFMNPSPSSQYAYNVSAERIRSVLSDDITCVVCTRSDLLAVKTSCHPDSTPAHTRVTKHKQEHEQAKLFARSSKCVSNFEAVGGVNPS